MEGGGGDGENFDLSLGLNGLSRDLLQKFMKQGRYRNEDDKEGDGEDIELSLGLSMNGRFGVDPARKKLKRSSSIANLVFTADSGNNGGGQQARGVEFDTYAPLVRTRSLPTETEEEWRRRKELQYMRRMEARKKRMEKLKNGRVMKEKENGVEDVNSSRIVNGSVDNGSLDDGAVMVSSEGSVGLQRSGSSGSSDLQSPHIEVVAIGANQNVTETPTSQEPAKQEPAERDMKGSNELLKKAMLDMPYVTTLGEGPNGQKIEGFLYRYRKGEEVRIVCVCHGTFLTPAEFVKHGGGGDVEHPLKHIVVNPFPLL